MKIGHENWKFVSREEGTEILIDQSVIRWDRMTIVKD